MKKYIELFFQWNLLDVMFWWLFQVTPSPSTALIGTPSPGTLLNVGSPGNPQLHVPSPGSSAFVPAPSPQSLGIHMPSPASGFMGPQGKRQSAWCSLIKGTTLNRENHQNMHGPIFSGLSHFLWIQWDVILWIYL